MKLTSLRTNTWCSGLIILLLFLAASCSSRDNSSKPENMSKEATNYEIPKEKMQLWESLKNNALKDYNVCQEHCGYEQECLDRCERAYETRLDRDYKSLTAP